MNSVKKARFERANLVLIARLFPFHDKRTDIPVTGERPGAGAREALSGLADEMSEACPLGELPTFLTVLPTATPGVWRVEDVPGGTRIKFHVTVEALRKVAPVTWAPGGTSEGLFTADAEQPSGRAKFPK